MAEPARKYDPSDDPYNPANLGGMGIGTGQTGDDDDGDTGQAARPVLQAIKGGGETSAPTGKLRSAKEGEGKGLSDDELKNRETSANGQGGTRADQAETQRVGAGAKASDTVGKGYKDDNDESGSWLGRKAKKYRRQIAVTAASSLIIGGGFGISGVISGPMQVAQASKLLATQLADGEDTGDLMTSRMLFYGLAGNAAKGRLGYTRDKVANKVEAEMNSKSGLKSVYSASRLQRNTLIGYEILDQKKASSLVELAQESGIKVVDSLPGQGIDGKPVKDGKFLDYRGQKFSERRSATRIAVKSTGIKASSLASRLLIKRAGVSFKPFTGKLREKAQNWLEFRTSERERMAKEDKLGSQSPEIKAAQADENKDANGNANPDPDSVDASQQTQGAIDEAKAIDTTTLEGKNKLTSLKNVLGKVGGGIGVGIGLACTAQQLGDRVPQLWHEQADLPMMRGAWRTLSGGDQVRSNHDVSLDEVGVLNTRFRDPETKSSWWSAAPVLAAMGVGGAGLAAGTAFMSMERGEKPVIFQIFDQVQLLRPTCSFLDAVGNLPILKQINDLSGAALDAALSPFGLSVQGLIDSALGLMFNPIDLFAQGAQAGIQDMFGIRHAANATSESQGGQDLTPAQEGALHAQTVAHMQQDFAESSLYDRYLDPYNIQSAFGRMAMTIPTTYPQLITTLTRMPTTFASAFGSAVFRPASAWTPVDFDYGFAKKGVSIERQNSESFQDPYANAEKVEPRLDELNEQWGPCYGMKVNPANGDFDPAPAIPESQKPERCRTQLSNPDYINFGNYLTAKSAEFAMGCRYDDADSCRNLGFGANQVAAGTQVTSTTGSAEDLARQLLNNPKITFTTPLAKQALQDAAAGKESAIEARCTNAGRTSAPLSAELLQVLMTISNTHSVGIGYFTNGCHSDTSFHYQGKGVDINTVDGQVANGKSSNDRTFMREVTGILPDGSELGQSDCASPPISPINKIELITGDPCNHIHMGIP